MRRIRFCVAALLLLSLLSCSTNTPKLALRVPVDVTTSTESFTLVLRNEGRNAIMAPIYLETIEKYDGTNWVPLERKGYHRTAFWQVTQLAKGEEKYYTVNLVEDYFGFLAPGEYRIPISCDYKQIMNTGEWLQIRDAWYFSVK